LELDGLVLFEPPVHRDRRGWFMELWSRRHYPDLPDFVQDNASYSRRDVLRGLHFQHPNGQAKLINVTLGEVYDVTVDLRRGSPTFGQWAGCRLSAGSGRQLYVPPGFAHGFVTTSDHAVLTYKCSAFFDPNAEHTLLWNDADIGIEWPVDEPILSEKDLGGTALRNMSDSWIPPYPAGM
jgi:dTDP-4-dehydrorhamnose 3,5-epimerase